MAGSTATRTGLQLELIKSVTEILFYRDCISKVSWSHQLIQRLCLKRGKKLHLVPSSRWCEHPRARCWHSWRGKRRPCGAGSRLHFPIRISFKAHEQEGSDVRHYLQGPSPWFTLPKQLQMRNKIQQPWCCWWTGKLSLNLLSSIFLILNISDQTCWNLHFLSPLLFWFNKDPPKTHQKNLLHSSYTQPHSTARGKWSQAFKFALSP